MSAKPGELQTPRVVVSLVLLCFLALAALTGVQGTATGSTSPSADTCQVPRYEPSPDASVGREDNFPYQDWIANADAQAAVANVNSALSQEFASPGADDGTAALSAGLIGVAVDHYDQQFDVVVDPALVDPDALGQKLQAIANDAGSESGSASSEGSAPAGSAPLAVKVIAGCNSSSELLEAQSVIDKRAWSPDAAEASYAFELDAATSTYHVTIDEKNRSTADGLCAAPG